MFDPLDGGGVIAFGDHFFERQFLLDEAIEDAVKDLVGGRLSWSVCPGLSSADGGRVMMRSGIAGDTVLRQRAKR